MLRTTMTTSTLFPSDAEAERLLVGPDSVTWRRVSDARLYSAALYPLLLQVAHPTVGAGVRDFSDFETRPWDRLLRTLDYVSLLVYGGNDAIAVGRRLRAMHKGFQGVREDGARYYALEPEAYAWVHATLIETYVAGHAHFGTPMNGHEREVFYREYRGLGRLLGIRERDLPDSWTGFREYFDATVEEVLVRTESVDRVLRSVTDAPMPVPMPMLLWRTLRVPAAKAMWVGGIGLAPVRFRERLSIRWTRREEAAFRALGTVSRAITPVLPRSAQVMGPAQLRMRRRAIAGGPFGALAQDTSPADAAASAAA
jgi:uncharacterized protein (DUF2236 family)